MKKILKFTLFCSLIIIFSCTSKINKISLKNEGIGKIEFFTFGIGKDILLTNENGESFKINKNGQEKLEFKILDKIKKKNNFYIIQKDKKIGVLNENYKKVIEILYDDIENLGKTEFLKVQRSGKKYLLRFNNYTLSQEYDEIEEMKDGSVIKIRQGDNIWYLDENGNEIKILGGKNILFWRGDVAVTVANNKYGLINLKNGKIIENLYEEIYFSDDNILVRKDGKYYLNGKYLDNITRIYPTMEDVLIYDIGKDKFGLFNLKDLRFSQDNYDEVMFRYNNYIIVGKDGKYGIIDKYNEKSPEFRYSYVIPAGVDSFAGGTDEGTGLVALIVGDKQVTEEKYENLYSLIEGYYLGEIDGKLFLINKNGKELLSMRREDIVYYNNEALIIKEKGEQVVYKLKNL